MKDLKDMTKKELITRVYELSAIIKKMEDQPVPVPDETEHWLGNEGRVVAELTLSGTTFTVGYTHNANPDHDAVFIRNGGLFEPDYMSAAEASLLIQALHVCRDGIRGF